MPDKTKKTKLYPVPLNKREESIKKSSNASLLVANKSDITKKRGYRVHLATITILVKDRQTHASEVNQILTDNGHLIMARLGVNVQRRCSENCTAMITVAVEAAAEEISAITKKLNKLYGIVAKACVVI